VPDWKLAGIKAKQHVAGNATVSAEQLSAWVADFDGIQVGVAPQKQEPAAAQNAPAPAAAK
jgi:hypothetical protein